MDKFEDLVEGEDYILLDGNVKHLDELTQVVLVSKDKLIRHLQFEVEALTKYVAEVANILLDEDRPWGCDTERIHEEVLNLISRWDRKQREYFAKQWDWPID